MKKINTPILKELTKLINDNYNSKFQKIAETILNNKEDFPKVKINKLAELSQSSISSITRFCKYLGFNGYKEFAFKLSLEIEEVVKQNQLVKGTSSSRAPIKNRILGKPFAIRNHLVDLFLQKNDDKLLAIHQLIISSKRIFLFGKEPMIFILNSFKYDLEKENKSVVFSQDLKIQANYVSLIKKEDLVFFLDENMNDKELLTIYNNVFNNAYSVVLLSKKSLVSIKNAPENYIWLNPFWKFSLENILQLPLIMALFKIFIFNTQKGK